MSGRYQQDWQWIEQGDVIAKVSEAPTQQVVQHYYVAVSKAFGFSWHYLSIASSPPSHLLSTDNE